MSRTVTACRASNASRSQLTFALVLLTAMASALLLGGCESSGGSALLGGAAGAAAGAGGYEYHLNQQKNKVEEDYEEGRIDQNEYEIRMDQINRDSLVQ